MDATDRRILEIAGRRYRHGGSLERAVRDELDMSAVAFWQRVVALLADPEAELEQPALVHRLQRLMATRRAARTSWNPMRQSYGG